jgi:hypothetical protein
VASGDDDISKRFFAGEDVARKSSTALPVASPQPPVRVARTVEVIAQAGVNQIRSPWRIARFVGGALVAVLALLFGLSRLGIVNLPMLSNGRTDAQKVFSGANDDASLRALRDGKPKPPPTPTAAIPVVPHPLKSAEPAADTEPTAKKEAQAVEQLAEADKQRLAELYAASPTSELHAPTKLATAAPAVDSNASSLTGPQVAQTIAKFQGGFAGCIDRELKRNPAFPGGKIRIVTTIGGSGIVRQAKIQGDDAALTQTVAQGELGGCLVAQTKRMVFPSFGGDPIDVEIPLVLKAGAE